MFFFRRNRRPDLLASRLDERDWATVREQAPVLDGLPVDLQARVQGVTRLLMAEKNFEGCGGLALSPDMPLVVSAQAALLQLGPGADYYPGLDSVLIYPEAFVVEHPRLGEDGLITEGEEELAGESWQRGAVILSWEDVARESADPGAGYNVVLHEFAHQLDEQTGEADGTPLLDDTDLARRWIQAFSEAFERHVGDLDKDRHILFDEDAGTSPAEFFATAAELFFTVPGDFQKEFPGPYGALREHLGLDPAAW